MVAPFASRGLRPRDGGFTFLSACSPDSFTGVTTVSLLGAVVTSLFSMNCEAVRTYV